MKITPVKEHKLIIPNDHSRSGGVHLTDITRDIGFQMGYIPPEFLTSEMHPEKIILGLAWEDYVFPRFHPEVCYHPGEVKYKGIAMTTDGVSYVQQGGGEKTRVHECKLTWKSMKKEADLQAEWLWLSQTMMYCVGWDTDVARYHIYWVNGNYKYGTPEGMPNYRLYDLHFTPRELNDNARMILNRGKERHGL